jgi:signal transduction histidine kinase
MLKKFLSAWGGVWVAALVFSLVAAALLVHHASAKRNLLEGARSEVEQLASVAAIQLDGDLHRQLTQPEQAGSAEHLRALAPLLAFHKASKDLVFVYSAILDQGTIKFVLSTNFLYRAPGDELPADTLMQPYTGVDADFMRALRNGVLTSNPTPVQEPEHALLSGLSPFFDSQNKLVGVVGVDMLATTLEARQRQLTVMVGMLMVINAIVSSALGVLYTYVQKRAVTTLQMASDLQRERVANTYAGNVVALAGVVAHEFSQHLTAASGYVDMALAHPETAASCQLKTKLSNAAQALERSDESISQLRTLAGGSFSTLERVSLASLLDAAIVHLQSRGLNAERLKQDASCDSSLYVLIDKRQATTAIVHILRNALEADFSSDVIVSIVGIDLENSHWLGWQRLFGSCSARELAGIVACNQGEANPNVIAQMGQPFFTNKGPGRGLGFAVVRGTLKAMGGALLLQSHAGVTRLALAFLKS